MKNIETAIFFSFDLSDSVGIKNKIYKNKEDLLKNYYSKLIDFETSFYELILKNKFKNISLDKLYLVKTIGDEYWYLYLGVNETIIAEFIGLVQELTKIEPLKYNIGSKPIFEKEHEDLIVHRYKFYIDKVNKIQSFTDLRLKKLVSFLTQKINSGVIAKLKPKEDKNYTLNKYLGTIGLSSIAEATNSSDLNLANRFDPIGLEADLFFRCNKEISRPQRVHIGENLYKELSDAQKSEYEVIRKFIPKGFNDEYTIYRLMEKII